MTARHRANNVERNHSSKLSALVVVAMLSAVVAVGLVPPALDDVSPGPLTAAAAVPADEPYIDVANLDPVPERMWGVSGIEPAETQTPSLDVLVWDMVQIDDRMFVGGAFLNVQEDGDATPIPQAFVAAFDARTGDWIDTWRPTLDRAVYALENFNGTLLVGGEFETVNGTSRTGLVGLDPITGQVDPTFSGYVERPWSDLRAMVRDLRAHGDDVYIVGNFSHVVGAWGVRTRVYKAARLSGSIGTVNSDWRPEVTGSGVWGVDVNPSGSEVYLAGYFSAVNSEPNTGNFHTVDAVTGASVAGKVDIPRNYPPSQPEFFDVVYGQNNVFAIGEQHIVQVLRESDQQMLGYHHAGQSNDGFEWTGGFAGGAYQAGAKIGDWVVAGCHCTYSTRNGYINHYSSFTQRRTTHRLLMIYSAGTGELYEPFEADVHSPRDGSWAFTGDTFGCLWAGGDFHVGGVDHGQSRWLGGIARFCPTEFDPDAPPPPEPNPDALIEAGSEWAYNDSGDDLGTAWREPSYNDAGWARGNAEFGFGDGDETTEWAGGSTTYYARTDFDFNESRPTSLALSLKADDGAVVYLNGVELVRENLPDGTITSSTEAVDWKSNSEEKFLDYIVPADALVAGRNVVAVETHNVWRRNNDLSFDLALSKSTEAVPNIDGPLIPINSAWQYVDDASSAPQGWLDGMADSSTGVAPLGFGENFLATEVASGNTTYYFTRNFHVEDPAAINELTLGLQADDGAVVYINGQEVHRFNMPNGVINHLTEATTWVSGKDEKTLVETVIPAGMLVAGSNTVAVELHNVWAGNNDLIFDLSLDDAQVD